MTGTTLLAQNFYAKKHITILEDLFQAAKDASLDLALLNTDTINEVLNAVAQKAIASTDMILEANAKDLSRMDPANPM